MASRPREARLKALLLTLGKEELGDEIDGRPTDYLDWALSQLAGGTTITALAQDLAERLNEGCTRTWLSGVLQRGPGDGRARVRAARAEAAGVLAEQAVEIADRPVTTAAEVQGARLQVETRRWLAGVFDRDSYGEKPAVQVTLSLGQLHIDALRAPSLATAKATPLLDVESTDYEIVEPAEVEAEAP